MHLFKRSKSTASRQSARQPDPAPAPSTSTASSRPPLVTQTNIDLQASLPALPSVHESSSSSDLAVSHSTQSKQTIARKISHRDADEYNKSKPSQPSASPPTEAQASRGWVPPPRTSSRSAKSTYANHPDMYTQNDLTTFSFGAPHSAPSPSSLSPSVDPLSRPRDETDSDEVNLNPDTTPRPSVVGSQHPRSNQSQPSMLEDGKSLLLATRINSSGRRARIGEKSCGRDSDAASYHTFGTSSASASVSSLSRPSGSNSRATSRISHSSTTPQTSGNDLTSDEEIEMDGRHPLPPEPLEPMLPPHLMNQDQESSLYLSEEDFDAYPEEYEHDNDGIEIDSVINEGSDRGTYFDYCNPSQESICADYTQRRCSIPMPIPSTPSDWSYTDHRARENSQATVRRPSKSLEDIHSFSFGQASGASSSGTRGTDDRLLSPAPTSVPESEGDWRDLRKRSVHRDKDLPLIAPHMGSTTATAGPSSSKSTTSNSMLAAGSSATHGLDTSWMQYGVHGLVGFDMDEMADIVGESSMTGRRASNYSFRKGSASSAFRRHSTVSSTNVDIMHKNILGIWANQRYHDQRQMWTFTQEKDCLPDVKSTNQRPNGIVERERPSISSLFAPRSSTATEHSSISGSIPFLDGPSTKEEKKPSSKDKSAKEPWRGMALNSEEIWRNASTGRFRITRKNAISLEVGKPPQQRLNITYIRNPNAVTATNRDVADGPAVTIHKHSKAGAFSISRHYRQRTQPSNDAKPSNDTTVALRNPSSRGLVSSKESSDSNKKTTSMIMLAPRHVQKSYTSTNTTRKLESHGLLDDTGVASPRDVERMRRERERERQEARAKEKGKARKELDKVPVAHRPSTSRAIEKSRALESPKKAMVKPETKSRDIPMSGPTLPDTSEGSSADSVVVSSTGGGTLVDSSTAGTAPDHSEDTNHFSSVEQSLMSSETTLSDRTVSRDNFYRNQHRRRSIMDDFDDDDSSDERPRHPTRTTYRETYAALPPEVFEAAHQEHPSHGLFGWGKSRNGDRGAHRANLYLEASYNPPWPVTAPRFNSETRKGIVDDLNMSFQDVGLLPATGEIKSSSHNAEQKRKRDHHHNKHAKRPEKQQTDILAEVPGDALYMLLPLWPGETDPGSVKRCPFSPPNLSTHTRQYLLIYYKTPPPAVPRDEGQGKVLEKKRSRNSPTSSHDSANKRDERSVLLSTFHISARVVSYRELQGCGIRIPDVGLAVSGPLEDAYESMPSHTAGGDYVIGVCHSRESGIEFVPEGFEKMGLSRSIPNPRPIEVNEDDDSSSLEPLSVLTPMGRAVMEMAWLGGMALTSFQSI